MPYFRPAAAMWAGFSASVTISRNACSIPAGAKKISNRAVSSVSFVKFWTTPFGMLIQLPAVPEMRSPSAQNVISPSRM